MTDVLSGLSGMALTVNKYIPFIILACFQVYGTMQWLKNFISAKAPNWLKPCLMALVVVAFVALDIFSPKAIGILVFCAILTVLSLSQGGYDTIGKLITKLIELINSKIADAATKAEKEIDSLEKKS